MLNVSELLSDPDSAQAFTIQRSTGSFQLGGWQNATTSVPAVGVITPASEWDLRQVAEGDRVTGAMTFHTATPLYQTHGGANAGLSDILVWRGDEYRIAQLLPFGDYGLYKAVAVRVSGE